MSTAMKASHWTTSYNSQFRDDAGLISPNAGEPMYHFNGHYDASHWQRDPGFYPTRAKLAATAKMDATMSGRTVRQPEPGSNVGYGAPPAKARTTSLNHTMYAPGPDPATQQYSALRQSGSTGLQTQRIGATVGDFNGTGTAPQLTLGSNVGSPSYGASQGFYARSSNGESLWTAPILKHGDKSSYTQSRNLTAAGPAYASFNGSQSARGASNGGFTQQQQQFGASSSSQQQGGLVDSAFVDSPEDWRYDSRGIAMQKGVELRENTDPRRKYHIPGYSGFVRGKNFAHGETFAKVCADETAEQQPRMERAV
jgi:hypothetical protein